MEDGVCLQNHHIQSVSQLKIKSNSRIDTQNYFLLNRKVCWFCTKSFAQFCKRYVLFWYASYSHCCLAPTACSRQARLWSFRQLKISLDAYFEKEEFLAQCVMTDDTCHFRIQSLESSRDLESIFLRLRQRFSLTRNWLSNGGTYK